MTVDASRCRVSAFVDSAEAADEAVYRLGLMGTPRDLVEVAVSEAAAQRFYGRRVRQEGSQMVRGAAAGALCGLLVGIAVSLLFVALPGWELSRWMFMAQLLGPNAATAMGAVIGAGIGALLPPVSRATIERALEREAILIVVLHCVPELAPAVRELLEACGASDVRIET